MPLQGLHDPVAQGVGIDCVGNAVRWTPPQIECRAYLRREYHLLPSGC